MRQPLDTFTDGDELAFDIPVEDDDVDELLTAVAQLHVEVQDASVQDARC